MRYVKASNELKIKATDKLNIDLDEKPEAPQQASVINIKSKQKRK
jgi:hypothetical protein